jgi:aerobic-type carbon monoxide dehydrogenase small subunit (CoxS/CutS family)
VDGLFEASVRFEQIIETMEVLLDKKTMQRIKLGEKQYRKKACVVARDSEEIRKVLSS